MPDLIQVQDDILEQKLEELLEFYRYDDDHPSIDSLLIGSEHLTLDHLHNHEIVTNIEFCKNLLDGVEDKFESAMVPKQRREVLARLYSIIKILGEFSPELLVMTVSILDDLVKRYPDSIEGIENNEDYISVNEIISGYN